MTNTKTACVQMDVEIGNVAANRAKIIERMKEAARSDARLIIFPECALTGYCFNSLEEAAPFAEATDGPSAERIQSACRETNTHAVVGYIERDGAAFYNAAMLVGPDGVAGNYRKVHMPYIGIDRFLTPGDRPFEVLELPFGKVGMIICYDSSFPESARVLKLLGAELIILPTNWPTGAWRTPEHVVNARANENHINFAAVNRVGTERGWQFIGRTKIADYNGDTIREARREGEEIIYADIDFAGANNNRIVNVAGAYEVDRIADRRPEFYGVVAEKKTLSQSAD